jgi:hypothetical protein
MGGGEKKAGRPHPCGQPASASNILAGQVEPELLNASELRRLRWKTSATNSIACEEDSSPIPPPDPYHPLAAYGGSSLTRVDAAGVLKSGPSLSPLGAQSEPGGGWVVRR